MMRLRETDDGGRQQLENTASQTAYETSPEMLEWIRGAAGLPPFRFDLAASEANAVCPRFSSDLLAMPSNALRDLGGPAFMNPPYSPRKLGPLLRKAFDIRTKSRIHVVVLIPANSLGTRYMGELMGGYTESHRQGAAVHLHVVPRYLPFLLGGRRTSQTHSFTPVALHLLAPQPTAPEDGPR